MAGAVFISPHGAHANLVHDFAIPASTNYVVTSGANADASITLDADTARPNIVSQVFWSYSAAPTGGRVTIDDGTGGSSLVFDTHVTATGFQSVTFDPHISLSKNTATTIKIFAGGGSVVGKLGCNAYKMS